MRCGEVGLSGSTNKTVRFPTLQISSISCNIFYADAGSNFIAAPFMQYRKPVGGGPSSNTCPRCPWHAVHRTSERGKNMME
mmetsp:Transcript_6306/g.25207  ORF Transcript_6306/g.25207 Transcript_6306/m.25207 type:complete len:81 (+) Transcript_6306:2124-2366(+)